MISLNAHPASRAAHVTLGVTLGLLVLSGCGLSDLGDHSGPTLSITNATDEPLTISETNFTAYTVRPGVTLGFALSGHSGDCIEWTLHAVTADGVEAASVGPPLCDGDQWTITQSDLDQARQDSGVEAPTPTPSTS
jgi:hypothetical protein